jgi:hypothetical protein
MPCLRSSTSARSVFGIGDVGEESHRSAPSESVSLKEFASESNSLQARRGGFHGLASSFVFPDRCCAAWRNPGRICAIAVFIPMVFQEHKGRWTPLRLHQLGTMPDHPVWHRRGLHAKPILSRGAARCAPTSSRVTSCGAAPGTACYHAGMADQAQRRHP